MPFSSLSNSKSTFTRWCRDHGPSTLARTLLLSERQGQQTSLKGELASFLTERENDGYCARSPLSCLTAQRQSAYSHFPCQATPVSGNAEKKADPYHLIGTAVPLDIDGVYTRFAFLIVRNVGLALGHPLEMKRNQS